MLGNDLISVFRVGINTSKVLVTETELKYTGSFSSHEHTLIVLFLLMQGTGMLFTASKGKKMPSKNI